MQDPADDGTDRSPLRALDVLAAQEVTVAPGLRHLELYTMRGLLTLLWHGDPTAEHVVLAMGGAMGGLLGPADGLYHDLGTALAERGIGTIRVGYRRPDDLSTCVHDLAAVADLSGRSGARRFVTVGHSFGGAVAVQTGALLGTHCAGVVTLATQSAGCERAEHLAETPLLLVHGDRDELLPLQASEMVRLLAGHGELVVLPDTGHLLREAGVELRQRLLVWIPARLDEPTGPGTHGDPTGRRGDAAPGVNAAPRHADTLATVFHLAQRDEWIDAVAVGGPYTPSAFADDGFVHCSTTLQVERTANTWFAGRDDLVLVELDPTMLGDTLVFEPGSLGEAELFPHVYAPIPLAAVRDAAPLRRDRDGHVRLLR